MKKSKLTERRIAFALQPSRRRHGCCRVFRRKGIAQARFNCWHMYWPGPLDLPIASSASIKILPRSRCFGRRTFGSIGPRLSICTAAHAMQRTGLNVARCESAQGWTRQNAEP